jgi:hypothetical protein
MKNDNTQANHRGSSPPFQDPELDFLQWLNGLKTIGQRDEAASAVQIARRPVLEKKQSFNLNDDGSLQAGG